jgi:DNA invertase Pin-like site-specific DNA recombinase
MKAFAYVRVSGSGQVQGGGFDRQLQAIQKYSMDNSIEIVDTFQEEGISGTQENRPALARLLVSLEQNRHGIKTVIIEKLDRLARDLMVQEAIIRDFKLKGFELISAAEGPDLLAADPTRELIRQVFGAVAQYEKSMLVSKLKASRERVRATSGKCEGRKGYKDTEEGRAIIEQIKELRKKRKNYKRRTWQQIADQLNSEGKTTMEGRTWTLQRVQQTAAS